MKGKLYEKQELLTDGTPGRYTILLVTGQLLKGKYAGWYSAYTLASNMLFASALPAISIGFERIQQDILLKPDHWGHCWKEIHKEDLLLHLDLKYKSLYFNKIVFGTYKRI